MDTGASQTVAKKRLELLAVLSPVLWVVGICAGVGIWLPIQNSMADHLTDDTIEAIYICIGFFVWVPAIMCGHVAISRIRRSAGLKGLGLAYMGLVLAYIAASLLLLVAVFAILFSSGDHR